MTFDGATGAEALLPKMFGRGDAGGCMGTFRFAGGGPETGLPPNKAAAACCDGGVGGRNIVDGVLLLAAMPPADCGIPKTGIATRGLPFCG
jgi:hypothetical protein